MANDRRVRKSKAAIKQAFLNLLKEYEFNRITVQQLSDSADISRGTFYTYYVDKYDLLETMENEKIEEIQNFINQRNMLGKKENIEENVKDIMEYLINHINENIIFYKRMFDIGQASMLQEKMYNLILSHLSSYKSNDDMIEGIPFSYFMSYVSGAGISIIKYWVQDSERINKDKLVHHFYNIVSNGVMDIIKKSSN